MTIKTILAYLDGKKTYIGAIAVITIPFLALKGVIDNDTAAWLGGVIGILLGGGKVATNKLGIKKNKI